MATTPPPELGTTEARQGRTTGHVRWILGVGLALAVVAMLVLLGQATS